MIDNVERFESAVPELTAAAQACFCKLSYFYGLTDHSPICSIATGKLIYFTIPAL